MRRRLGVLGSLFFSFFFFSFLSFSSSSFFFSGPTLDLEVSFWFPYATLALTARAFARLRRTVYISGLQARIVQKPRFGGGGVSRKAIPLEVFVPFFFVAPANGSIPNIVCPDCLG